ncbi:ketoacyl-ACP synthase III family protein [Jatrophihabitans sp.]|uniref:ketoacyl-ACP synthase III family protein n=1 Tax=Jatrophihabitans sp. TaxID=1932789 RepID=UPI002CE1463B|nr:ketoacyl-ACP synthase III family protein [Jatrophihabitans sp.]
MRWPAGIAVESARTWLPETGESAAEALHRGALTADELVAVGYRQVPVSQELAPPDMAVRAGRRALSAAGREPAEVDLLVHAWTYFQGQEFFSAPHYVADRLGCTAATPLGVQQMCNGGAAALVSAANQLTVHRDSVALVTTADRFCSPGFDRWSGDYGLWYGDGATAAVLSDDLDRPGSLVLTGAATAAAIELHAAHLVPGGFTDAPGAQSLPVDIRAAKRSYLQRVGKQRFAEIVAAHVRSVIREAAAEAGVALSDERLRVVAAPRLGASGLGFYAPVISSLTAAAIYDGGAGTGHLGAGDTLANLAALADDQRLRVGDSALVLSAGAGFTWTCLVVRRDQPPRAERRRLVSVSNERNSR